MEKKIYLSDNTELMTEWHPSKNDGLKAERLLAFSNKKAWWQCSKNPNHEWECRIADRSKGKGCPYCNHKKVFQGETDLQTVNPELASEWNLTKNGDLHACDFFPNSNQKVWWTCKNGHEWMATIKSRHLGGNGCPYCNGKLPIPGTNDLLTVNPELAAEWHLVLNGKLTAANVTSKSNMRVWWQCRQNSEHEWKASIDNRALGTGCPYCEKKLPFPGESDLATVFPKLSEEWHPSKNGKLKPEDFLPFSNKKVWWKCGFCGHEWKSRISNRSFGKDCPKCHKRR